jgi:hypothetical protein
LAKARACSAILGRLAALSIDPSRRWKIGELPSH